MGEEFGANITLEGNGDSIFEGGEQGDIFIVDQDDSGSNVLIGKGGNDTITGGNRQDIIIGGDDFDRLQGGFGVDFLIGGNGNDAINGGTASDPDLASDDFVYFTGSPDEYQFITTPGEPGFLPTLSVIDTVDGRDGIDGLSNIEVLVFGSGDVLRLFPTPLDEESSVANDETLLNSSNAVFAPTTLG